MQNLHINLPPPLTKAQKRAKRLREEKIQEDNQIREDMRNYGTSFNRISRRKAAMHSYTRMTIRFDELMKEYIDLYHQFDDAEHKNHFHSKMVELGYNTPKRKEYHNQYLRNFSQLPPGAAEDTSDNTIELEIRPKKRRYPYVINQYSSLNSFCRSKRQRLFSAFMDDSTERDVLKLNDLSF
ncbi:unnamed protein product [Rhizophagus irregularis]|nr:unnamed protein product [Rhizophagus irregularis]